MWRVIVAAGMLAGCVAEEIPDEPPLFQSDSIIKAAVSGDGIAVGDAIGTLHINDGGVARSIRTPGTIAYVLEPAVAGVWVGVEGEAIFIHRGGERRYPLEGAPTSILPAGDGTAYVVINGTMNFIGEGDHRVAQRRSWEQYPNKDALFHDLSQDSGGGPIHRFDF